MLVNGPSINCGVFPATIITAIVSPTALPMPIITPVTVPLFAAGKTALKTACSLLQPSANAPSK